MHSDLQNVLNNLRSIQYQTKVNGLDPGQGSRARHDFLIIEERLARTLGELDYLVNLKMTMKRDS